MLNAKLFQSIVAQKSGIGQTVVHSKECQVWNIITLILESGYATLVQEAPQYNVKLRFTLEKRTINYNRSDACV